MVTMETMGRAVTARWVCSLLVATSSLCGQQFKADKAGPPPAEVAPGIVQTLEKSGFQITNSGALYCEIWLRTSLPSPQAASHEQNVTLANVPIGVLVGVIRFDGKGSDRRGQIIQPGAYILRYAIMPMNDDHQGAAPQRDFLLLSPAAEDRDVNAAGNLDVLVAMSRKASLTRHPAVLSISKADDDASGFSLRGTRTGCSKPKWAIPRSQSLLLEVRAVRRVFTNILR